MRSRRTGRQTPFLASAPRTHFSLDASGRYGRVRLHSLAPLPGQMTLNPKLNPKPRQRPKVADEFDELYGQSLEVQRQWSECAYIYIYTHTIF